MKHKISADLLFNSIPITITPEPPPGIGEAVARILSWIYWLAWVAVVGAGVYGVLKIVLGDVEEGKKLVAGSIAGALLLAFLWVLISTLIA
ncbi:MAG: hypothetical protein OWQ48_00395 [Desulfurococcus sp.]|nr:hypothetical protein [Desulfurococcus sp.]